MGQPVVRKAQVVVVGELHAEGRELHKGGPWQCRWAAPGHQPVARPITAVQRGGAKRTAPAKNFLARRACTPPLAAGTRFGQPAPPLLDLLLAWFGGAAATRLRSGRP